jgi:hypothetical protein
MAVCCCHSSHIAGTSGRVKVQAGSRQKWNSLSSYLKQTEMPFSKKGYREVKHVLSGVWHQWEWGGYKEKVQEGECGGNTRYSCMKTEK